MAKRHGGIVTFGILGIFFGSIGVLYNSFLVVTVSRMKASSAALDPATADALSTITGPVLLSFGTNALSGAIALVAGIGVLMMRGWARVGFIVAAAITILNRLLTFPWHFTRPPTVAAEQAGVEQIAQQVGAVTGDLLTVAFNALVIWFFSRAAIKALFESATTPSSPTPAS